MTNTFEIKADDKNNADVFWTALDAAFPRIADQVRAGGAMVDKQTWLAIKSLEGFADGPDHARHALIEA